MMFHVTSQWEVSVGNVKEKAKENRGGKVFPETVWNTYRTLLMEAIQSKQQVSSLMNTITNPSITYQHVMPTTG